MREIGTMPNKEHTNTVFLSINSHFDTTNRYQVATERHSFRKIIRYLLCNCNSIDRGKDNQVTAGLLRPGINILVPDK